MARPWEFAGESPSEFDGRAPKYGSIDVAAKDDIGPTRSVGGDPPGTYGVRTPASAGDFAVVNRCVPGLS